MNTAAETNLAHVTSSDVYDPDDVVPRNSPLLHAVVLKTAPTPSPPPILPARKPSPPPSPGGGGKGRRKRKVRASQGDAVLISFMDSGRRPEIAIAAGTQALPSDSSEDSSDYDSSDSSLEEADQEETVAEASAEKSSAAGTDKRQNGTSEEPSTTANMGSLSLGSFFELKSLAADALGKLGLQETTAETGRRPTPPSGDHDVDGMRPQVVELPLNGTVRGNGVLAPSPSYSSLDTLSPHPPGSASVYGPGDQRSPTGNLPRGELPPIMSSSMASPRSDGNANVLPSIRDQLGDIQHLGVESTPAGYPQQYYSPPSAGFPYPGVPNHRSPPPVSPPGFHHGGALPSPNHPMLAGGPPYYAYANGMPLRHGADYSSSNTETPSTDHSGSTPATSTSIADRISIENLASNIPEGSYICKVPGCKAPPFQTQYLLNSHANVHSSARPHYCPVKGCPRSEGGKGFKRKNEMIRHGLVHESPGYTCPFCPEREHKYPRPDNLQRHVRVHHVDKDKDDPLLREVLSQRPDGPNRGRRRRAVVN